MPFNIEEVTPKENRWFTCNVQYEGKGRADFADDRGAAVGNVKMLFDEFGGSKIRMEVQQIERPESAQNSDFGLHELTASGRYPEPDGGIIFAHGLGQMSNPLHRPDCGDLIRCIYQRGLHQL